MIFRANKNNLEFYTEHAGEKLIYASQFINSVGQAPTLRYYEYGFLSILLYVWIHLCTSLLSADAFCLTKAFVSCTFNYLLLRKECLAYGRDPLCDRYTYIYCRFVIFNFIFDPVILFTQNKLFSRTYIKVSI